MSVTIANAIGTRLKTISGLRVFDELPENITPPTAIVAWPTIDYDAAMGGDNVATFQVHVLVARVAEKNAATKLSPFISPLGAKSVKAVIEAERTLAGSVSSSRVTRASVAPIEVGAATYLGATFDIEVYFTDYYH